MNIENVEITKKIKEVQDEYYNDSGKNIFFKKNQKLDCAKEITKKIDLDELLHYSMYIIPTSNRIFVDYTILKTFLSPETYLPVIMKFTELVENCLSQHDSYEYYLNLDTLTVSAFERYQDIFPLFYEICNERGLCYSDKLTKCIMLNTPNIGEILTKLFRPFMDKKTKGLITIFSKKESAELIPQIFS